VHQFDGCRRQSVALLTWNDYKWFVSIENCIPGLKQFLLTIANSKNDPIQQIHDPIKENL
jgi:hypothetical protein